MALATGLRSMRLSTLAIVAAVLGATSLTSSAAPLARAATSPFSAPAITTVHEQPQPATMNLAPGEAPQPAPNAPGADSNHAAPGQLPRVQGDEDAALGAGSCGGAAVNRHVKALCPPP